MVASFDTRSWGRLLELSGASGFLYRDAHYLEARVDLNPRVAESWVPSPLKLAEGGGASIFTAWFPHCTLGPVYREAGIFFDVVHSSTPAIFCPWMVVDDDAAMIVGRELLGYPKKMAAVTWQHDGNTVTSEARRRDTRLVSMKATLGEVVAEPPAMLGRAHRNVRSSLGLAVPKLLAFTPKEEVVETRRAEVVVELGASSHDPLTELGLGAVREAFLHRVNLSAGGVPLPVGPVSLTWQLRHAIFRSL